MVVRQRAGGASGQGGERGVRVSRSCCGVPCVAAARDAPVMVSVLSPLQTRKIGKHSQRYPHSTTIIISRMDLKLTNPSCTAVTLGALDAAASGHCRVLTLHLEQRYRL